MKGEKFQFVLNICGPAAHQAFDRIDGALGLSEQAAARGFANDDAAVRVEADDRRTESRTIGARDTLRLARLRIRVRDEAVGCPQIDAYNACHVSFVASKIPRSKDRGYSNSFWTLVTRFRMYERRFSKSLRRAMIFLRVAASPSKAASHSFAAL